MKKITHFPNQIKEIENEWIHLADGTRLAARIWIPENAIHEPIPAILEYIPYRKRDSTRRRDEITHRYFAGNGYAGVRVDIRGSGDSDGVIKDEYLEQELADGEEIIAWIADQPWCNGNVGMIGISWGGFNGLQIAARRPPALKSIITVCSTDDRYADDVHYMGGCLLGDNLSWASVMFSRNTMPPDREIVGDQWREMWFERLEGSGLWLKNWLEHQNRDEFWQHGSVCQNFEDIQIPVMAVSGWADGYSNSVFRLLEHLKVPRQGLIGPWSHRYPHDGKPGPAIGFLQECIRWWDKYLKGEDNDIDKEPMLKAWMQESMPPFTSYEERPGYWLGLNDWPSPKVERKTYALNTEQKMVDKLENVDHDELWVSSPLRLGMFAGKWCSYSAPPDLPGDQRDEDGGALIFETKPLADKLEIIGMPIAEFTVSVDKPVAMMAVRLSDIRLDGKATRVTYGVLNLTHYKSRENPEFLQPGKKYKVKLKLNDIGHVFPPGHKLRVSVSNSYFPLAWPAPELNILKIYTGESLFHLPVKSAEQDQKVDFAEAEGAEFSTRSRTLQEADYKWEVNRDLINDKSTMRVVKDTGTVKLEEIDLVMANYSEENYSVCSDDLNSVKGHTTSTKKLIREGWDIETKTTTYLTSDKNNFYIHAQVDAYENKERVFSKNFKEIIKRDMV